MRVSRLIRMPVEVIHSLAVLPFHGIRKHWSLWCSHPVSKSSVDLFITVQSAFKNQILQKKSQNTTTTHWILLCLSSSNHTVKRLVHCEVQLSKSKHQKKVLLLLLLFFTRSTLNDTMGLKSVGRQLLIPQNTLADLCVTSCRSSLEINLIPSNVCTSLNPTPSALRSGHDKLGL